MKRIGIILLIIVMLFSIFITKTYASVDTHYTLDQNYKRVPIPLTYEVARVIIDFGKGVIPLDKAEDLFLDKNENLYIVDTGNNRILKLDSNEKLVGIFEGPEDKPFNEPKGIYVDDDEDMYIADTGNARVVHLSPQGKFIEEFLKPESSLIDPNYPFKPAKVYIDPIGYMYILNENDYHGFITIDAYNRFRGYVAPTRLRFDFGQAIVRSFATEEQKNQIAKELPPCHSNFVIHDDGMIYATTIMVFRDQIKKLNSVGNDIYVFKHDQKSFNFFGEMSDENGNEIRPTFVDLAVDQNGIITAIEAESRKVYQYDAEGNLLTVFGGIGSWKGKFQAPSSIVVNKKGELYILDKDLNNIQIFRPTKFLSTIHEALKLYYEGKYEEALVPWQEVLKIDPNYSLAHKGIAKACMKREKWTEAMEHYKAGEDQGGYSEAYREFRHEKFREKFGWVVLFIFIILTAIVYFFRFMRKASDKYMNQMVIGKGGI